MHPLLSQPANQTTSAAKSSMAKDVDHAARPQSARNDSHQDDSTANFSHFFERDEGAKPSDQTLAVDPAETALKDDQPPETAAVAMAEIETPAPRKGDIFGADTPEFTPIEDGDAKLDAETAKAAQTISERNPTEIAKPNMVERPVVPHHFGWSGGSETTTKSNNSIGPDQRAAAHPPDGLTATGTTPKPITGAQAGQQSALPVQIMPPPDTTPRTERRTRQALTSETPGTPPLKRAQPAQTVLRNNPLVAGVMQQATDQAQSLKALSTEPLTLFTPDTTATPNTPPGSAPTRADMPVHIARQLVEVAQHLPSRPVDITLSPEELGRVRLSVIASETGIVVNVLAERPETLDLMRRHIDQLAHEFQNLGYDDISFSFSGAEPGTSDENDAQSGKDQSEQTSRDPTNDVMENTRIHLSTGAATGLDLRL